LASIVESLSGQADAANFVQGVTTARVLVWVLGDDQCQKHSLARLVLAALLQDVGRLPVIPGGLSIRVLRTQRPEWLEQQHPAIGAALFGSVRGVPIELPMLVAQHHEQLGGGGFPCALAARNILPESAILAAASRFAELCLTLPAATVPGANLAGGCSLAQVGKSMLAPAAEALVAEAEWGKWSLTFCNRIMDRVAEAEAIKHRQHLEEPGEGSTADDRVLHLHDQETSLHGTHLNPMPRPAGPILRDAQSLIQDD
jgi:hypothetical protein